MNCLAVEATLRGVPNFNRSHQRCTISTAPILCSLPSIFGQLERCQRYHSPTAPRPAPVSYLAPASAHTMCFLAIQQQLEHYGFTRKLRTTSTRPTKPPPRELIQHTLARFGFSTPRGRHIHAVQLPLPSKSVQRRLNFPIMPPATADPVSATIYIGLGQVRVLPPRRSPADRCSSGL